MHTVVDTGNKAAGSKQSPETTPTSPPPAVIQPPSAADLEVISNPMLIGEERASAGTGTLLNLEGALPKADVPQKPSAHDFFSQLNWTEQTSGSTAYAPFQDHLGASSDSSDSDSDSDSDDASNYRHDPFLSSPSTHKENGVPGSGVPFVNFDDFENDTTWSSTSTSQGRAKGHMKGRKIPTPESKRQEEAKLIEFSIAEDDEGSSKPSSTTEVTHTRSREEKQPSKGVFGVSFDPWGTPSSEYQHQSQGKTALEVSDLLGLGDSDNHSTASDDQSEVRAAGVEAFSNHLDHRGMKTNLSWSSMTAPVQDQFDPFGILPKQPSTSVTATPLQPQPATVSSSSSSLNDHLFNLLMDTPTTATVTSTSRAQPSSTAAATTTKSSRSTGSSPDPFANLLAPTVAQRQQPSTPPTLVTNMSSGGSASASHHRVSQPPHFNDHLSPLHSMSHGTGGSGGLGFVTSHSQPNLSAFGSNGDGFARTGQQQLPHQLNQRRQQQGFGGVRANPSYMGGGSASTSPRSTSPTPFSAHSSSAGNLLEENSSGGGGRTTLAGQSSPSKSASEDPFAQFGLGFMTGAKPQPPSSAPHKSPSQPVFKSQPTHSTPYQPYYMRPEASSAQGGTGKPPQSQPQAKVPSKSKSGSSIGSSSNSSSVFAPRKPNYNPMIGPESKTGMSFELLKVQPEIEKCRFSFCDNKY